ncbi:MAG: MBL fold metallo-hydrolase [Clostridia bacterium]|nr:MBL fold metallo-hydrolase [Clostridia bacterium]
MEIKAIPLGQIKTNCYLVSSQKAAIVIDPGFADEQTESFLRANADKERMILLTHAHFDHIGDALRLSRVTQTEIAIGELDNPALSDATVNLSYMFDVQTEPFSADLLFKDGDEYTIGDLKLRVILTPGHTKGGVCYLSGDKLFSGDTLFFESVGRTDLPGGDFSVLEESVLRLFELDDKIKVFPGHGQETTIGHEKKFNPYVRVGRKL